MYRLFIGLVVTVVLVSASRYYVDDGLALLIGRTFAGNFTWARYTDAIPDFLFPLVCIMTGVAFVVYRRRAKHGIFTPATNFFHLVSFAIPAAFITKNVMKFVFGSVNPRVWLHRPRLSGFHWFGGGDIYKAFPSGHMAVFTAITISAWRFFPRCRPYCPIFLALLGGALVVTNYHFLSDVIAGAYIGVCVEAVSHRLVHVQRGVPEDSAP